MPALGDIFGGGALFNFAGKLVDRLIPDKTKAAEMQLEIAKLQQSGELAALAAATDLAKGQLAINQVEAASGRLWVSGWRPFVGWVCGAGVAYATVVQPLFTFFANLAGSDIPAPVLDTGTLTTLLFGLLGLGGMRTYEKVHGATGTGN